MKKAKGGSENERNRNGINRDASSAWRKKKTGGIS